MSCCGLSVVCNSNACFVGLYYFMLWGICVGLTSFETITKRGRSQSQPLSALEYNTILYTDRQTDRQMDGNTDTGTETMIQDITF